MVSDSTCAILNSLSLQLACALCAQAACSGNAARSGCDKGSERESTVIRINVQSTLLYLSLSDEIDQCADRCNRISHQQARHKKSVFKVLAANFSALASR